MAKRLTEKQKEEIIKCFTNGETIDVLALKFGCTKLTIVRNLKKSLGEPTFNDLVNHSQSASNNINNKHLENNSDFKNKEKSKNISENNEEIDIFSPNQNQQDYFPNSTFLEIAPLDLDIDNSPRKELSSIHISQIDLPNVVYMIVDKQIELEVKLIKDYPEWEFLPSNDLNRKAIKIYLDLKIAKRSCNKEQKVIKVPNTDVFKIAAPILLSRGISRIVSDDKLIAL